VYNHTKAYCNLPYNCVKCGNPHDSKTCTKPKDTPAKCALCGGAHPANYRGCQVHKELQNKTLTYRKELNGAQQQPYSTSPQLVPNPTQQQRHRSYSQVAGSNYNLYPSNELTLNKFLEDFKALFAQLVQQNNMILQMLTTVINKLVTND